MNGCWSMFFSFRKEVVVCGFREDMFFVKN